MGIDGIGKKPPVGVDAGGGIAPAPKTGATFEVGGAEPNAPVGGLDAVDASSPLARLRAGEIDVEQYVDLRIDEAMHALQGMPPSDITAIRGLLREKIVSDPTHLDLVRQATGQTPAIPED